ncbi:hypothetical protein [Wufeng Murina leucogaster paramyxovirus 1]|nr:hypothetical protein [Wufeng Murina leucogaster paramyxovirus 1]
MSGPPERFSMLDPAKSTSKSVWWSEATRMNKSRWSIYLTTLLILMLILVFTVQVWNTHILKDLKHSGDENKVEMIKLVTSLNVRMYSETMNVVNKLKSLIDYQEEKNQELIKFLKTMNQEVIRLESVCELDAVLEGYIDSELENQTGFSSLALMKGNIKARKSIDDDNILKTSSPETLQKAAGNDVVAWYSNLVEECKKIDNEMTNDPDETKDRESKGYLGGQSSKGLMNHGQSERTVFFRQCGYSFMPCDQAGLIVDNVEGEINKILSNLKNRITCGK